MPEMKAFFGRLEIKQGFTGPGLFWLWDASAGQWLNLPHGKGAAEPEFS